MRVNVPSVPLILIAIGAMLLILAGLAFLVVALWTRLSARASRWAALAKQYPADGLPAGRRHARQTVQVGAVRYRRCVTVGIDPLGLWLWVQPSLVRFHPLFIPWDEVKRTQETRLCSRKAVQLVIGEPSVATITVYRKLFEDLSPYLAPGL